MLSQQQQANIQRGIRNQARALQRVIHQFNNEGLAVDQFRANIDSKIERLKTDPSRLILDEFLLETAQMATVYARNEDDIKTQLSYIRTAARELMREVNSIYRYAKHAQYASYDPHYKDAKGLYNSVSSIITSMNFFRESLFEFNLHLVQGMIDNQRFQARVMSTIAGDVTMSQWFGSFIRYDASICTRDEDCYLQAKAHILNRPVPII